MERAAFSLFLPILVRVLHREVEPMCLSNMIQECTIAAVQLSTFLDRESLNLGPSTKVIPHFTS